MNKIRGVELSRCALSISLAAALLAACGGSAMPISGGDNGTKGENPGKHSKRLYYAGREQTFIVPAGVGRLTVIARGGEGGGGYAVSPSGDYPGFPGRVYAVIPVQPGDKLYVFVGGSAESGGFNGGGLGGVNGYPGGQGYGGGGASDVRMGGDALKDRIVVAAGGGGAGAAISYGYAPGGAGGGRVGQSGGTDGYRNSGKGGAGGTQSGGGFGGAGGFGVRTSGNGRHGFSGVLGRGGDGGSGGPGGPYNSGEGGGGGGGGYYGGGGGGGGGTCTESDYFRSQGGGGGGGSSYVEPSAIKSRMWTGWRREGGDGIVIFSW